MHIVMVAFPTVGGSGMFASYLARELANRGHRITILSYEVPVFFKYGVTEKIKIATFPLRNYPLFRDTGPPYSMLLASSLAKIARKYEPDVIHYHYGIHHVTTAFLFKQLASTAQVLTLHGSDVHTLGKDWYLNEPLTKLLPSIDKLTSVSNFLSNLAQEVFGLSERPQTIHNFVDPELFSPEKGSNTSNNDKIVIVHASNFREVKNPTFLVKIFATIGKEYPEAELWMVGDGPLRRECYTIAKKNKILDQVRFLGVRRNINEILATADIVAVPSKIESFGLVAAEAMSSETPVWASAVGGVPEVVRHYKDGLLFENFNLRIAREHLCTLIEDSSLRRRLGKNGRKRVLECFSPDTIVPKYEALYASLS